MRICLVTPDFPPWAFLGIGTYVRTLAEGFAASGHQVTVVGCSIHEQGTVIHPWGRSISLDWAVLRAVKRTLSWLTSKPVLWRLSPQLFLIEWILGALLVRRFLRRRGNDFDIIEVSNEVYGRGILAPGLGVPVVVRLSSPTALSFERSKLVGAVFNWLEGRTCHRASLIIANSEAIKAVAASLHELPPASMRVIHHGIQDWRAPVQPTMAGALTLLYVGRAEDRKGTDLLVRALAEVLPGRDDMHFEALGCDIAAYVAGSGALEQCWARLREECPGRIRVRGRVSEEEKLEAYARSHWLVFPSRFESFGLPAVEALRAGTPLILARAGGLAEIGNMCPGTLFFEAGDPDGLTRCLAEAGNRGVAHALSLRAGARGVYEARFGAARMVADTLKSYQSLLDRATGS